MKSWTMSNLKSFEKTSSFISFVTMSNLKISFVVVELRKNK